MKHIYRILFLSAAVFFLLSCSNNNKNNNNSAPKKVIAEQEKSASDISEGESSLISQYNDDIIIPRVNIQNQNLIEYIQNVNLDFDTEEEQVIVKKDSENKNNLKIIVIDFDSVRNKYIITWETVQKDINTRTFIISYADIVGDHNLEIIFRGTGTKSEQILDLYRKTHSPAGIRLYYENIADIKIDGQIDIVEKERSSAYLLGQKNGLSFPVITYEKDEDSENLLDMVKKTFIWNYQSGRFIKSIEEKIPGEIIEEERLRELFNQGIEAYQDFLQGQWINTESGNVISFDKNTKEIAMYSKDVLEIYKWTDFISNFPHRVFISSRNDLIHFIRNNIRVKILKLNKINIEVTVSKISERDNPWNGTYEKISSDTTLFHKNDENNENSIILEGLYTGVNNTITFSGKEFVQKEDDKTRKGIFSVFEYNGQQIIKFRYLDSNRLVGEKKDYSIIFNSYDIDNTTVNEIHLQRGEIKSQYFDASGEDKIIYKQTIKNEESSSAE